MSDDEVLTNIRYFTLERRGPRTIPCRALVLAGIDLARRGNLVEALERGRGWGIEHVTLHLGRQERHLLVRSQLSTGVDAVVLVIADAEDLADLAALGTAPIGPRRLGIHRAAVVVMDRLGLSRIESIVDGLARIRPERVVFTWPFPPGEPPPRVQQVAAVLERVVPDLRGSGVSVGIKGPPGCALPGALRDGMGRSRNRWYVDARHQRDDALLFFPDVVRFVKEDVCRFCTMEHRCDGVADAWHRLGLVGGLRPVS